ncbi:MAG: hypothetical protein GTO53_06300, partial [Planctomycetales bacterium]|nr:hypothetical protein [Planctomycetales bacterium]
CDVYLVQRYRELRRQAALRIDVPAWGLHQLAVVGMLYVAANLFFALAASLFAANENLAWGVALAGNLLVNISVLAGLFAYFRQRHIDFRAVLGLDPHTRTGGWTAGLI